MTVALPQAQAVIADYVAAFNRGDADALGRLFTPDALIHGALGWGRLDLAMPIWRSLMESFGLQLHVEAILAEGDSIVVRFTERGTFSAPFRGAPPTGRGYELTAMEWFTLQDGLIHRRWAVRDTGSLFRQVGLLAA